MVAYRLHRRHHIVEVCDSFLALGCYRVGLLACLHHIVDSLADNVDVLRYFFYSLEVACSDLRPALTKELAELHEIIDQCRLIARGHGDDVIEGEIAENAGLDLNLLGINLPLHLIAGLKLYLG